MAPVIKGGQWKNSEDEVLKAAVMKYGMNNWSRVASLLNRKTARQCRARWYEWLDPFVKKTPWSQAEDEKLLHAVKVFPTQWKTIAPIVGRTAYQCVARYNELLDLAAGDVRLAPEDDPRLPRPGEIDAQPETRPAKADAVDLDDDEREMLAEARARLANTKGKKAKRKAREKQLEQKRKLALLQRRKEFEEAGITLKAKGARELTLLEAKTDNIQMMRPLPGAHDTSAEHSLPEDEAATYMRLKEIELAKERFRLQKQKLDEKRILKKLHADPSAGENRTVADIFSVKQRSILTLPAPNASDKDLLDIARAAEKQHEAAAEFLTGIATTSQVPAAPSVEAPTLEAFDWKRLLQTEHIADEMYTVELPVDDLADIPEIEDELADAARSNAKMRRQMSTLSSIYSRSQIIDQQLPRPIKLPGNLQAVVEMIESAGPPRDSIEAEMNVLAGELYLADNKFLDPKVYTDLLRDGMDEDKTQKLKWAFLKHAQKVNPIGADAKALRMAASELSEALASHELTQQIPECFEQIAPYIPASADHKYDAVCVWNGTTYELGSLDSEFIEATLKAEVIALNSQRSTAERQYAKQLRQLDKLTGGYKQKEAETIATLDQIYEFAAFPGD